MRSLQKALLSILIATAVAVGVFPLFHGNSAKQTLSADEVSGAAIVQPEDVLSLDQDPKPSPVNYELRGHFVLTAYEWTGSPCANGRFPTVGYTVACNSIPLGTRVYVEGYGNYVVEDRGAEWHSSNWMDIYLGDVAACDQFGVREANVYIIRS